MSFIDATQKELKEDLLERVRDFLLIDATQKELKEKHLQLEALLHLLTDATQKELKVSL